MQMGSTLSTVLDVVKEFTTLNTTGRHSIEILCIVLSSDIMVVFPVLKVKTLMV